MIKDDSYMIYCPKCGSEMKNTSRCCMKCGYLNPSHPSNKSTMKYFENTQNDTVSNGKFIISDDYNKKSNLSFFESNMKSCFIVNIIFYILTMAFILGYYFMNYKDISSVISSNVWIPLIIVPISYIYIYAYEILFIKLGYSWWKALIPIYNIMILTKSVFGNALLGLISFIPIVGLIFLIVLYYKLAIKFKRNGILMVLFPEIMLLFISFSEDSFDGFEIDYDGNYESVFKHKKIFLILCLLFILIGALIVIFKFPVIEYFKGKWEEVKEIVR